MKWIAKALLQRAISYLPDPRRWNYLFQRSITRTLPVTDEQFIERFKLAYDRLSFYSRHGTKPLEALHAFEFGAGWDLAGPVAYHAMGVNQQTVVDIRPGLRLELVSDQVSKLQRLKPRLEQQLGRPLRVPSATALQSLRELEQTTGIRYVAPSDARSTGLPAESIDLISTNSTLEHIPPTDLGSIFQELHRILAPDGCMVHFIDLKDHHSYTQPALGCYHFLTVPEPWWGIVNTELNYQNRLRRPEYLALFRGAGFEIVEEWCDPASTSELEEIRRMRLLPQYQGYTAEDLGVKIQRVVLKKA